MGLLSGVRRLLHWGPLLALSIITTISLCSINCLLQWWPPASSSWAGAHAVAYMCWNVLVLYNFFNAAFIGPGHVPLGWKPDEESQKCLQFCSFCKGFKAPRSHHCRKCNKCVMKMDHHCPWINNCVGHSNHASFTYFLFFAPLGCIHSLCILIPTMYRALNRPPYVTEGLAGVPVIQISAWGVIACMYGTGLALGVVLCVGFLCYMQLKTIMKNETGIESWIMEKAQYRELEEGEDPDVEFVFPYNLGWWENLRQVFSWDESLPRDGIWWPVLEGCDQYTLTVEQIKQKREKKDRSVLYTIKQKYSGAIFPITKGPSVCCRPPCTDEPRIPLEAGDQVIVSRWKKQWLYGDKVLQEGADSKEDLRVRGWFPRRCAVELVKNPKPKKKENTKETLKKDK